MIDITDEQLSEYANKIKNKVAMSPKNIKRIMAKAPSRYNFYKTKYLMDRDNPLQYLFIVYYEDPAINKTSTPTVLLQEVWSELDLKETAIYPLALTKDDLININGHEYLLAEYEKRISNIAMLDINSL